MHILTLSSNKYPLKTLILNLLSPSSNAQTHHPIPFASLVTSSFIHPHRSPEPTSQKREKRKKLYHSEASNRAIPQFYSLIFTAACIVLFIFELLCKMRFCAAAILLLLVHMFLAGIGPETAAARELLLLSPKANSGVKIRAAGKESWQNSFRAHFSKYSSRDWRNKIDDVKRVVPTGPNPLHNR